MATSLSISVSKSHLKKDNTMAVRIRMVHNRASKYFLTSVVVTRDQLNRPMTKVKDPAVVEALERKMKAMRDIIASIDGAEHLDAEQLYREVTKLLSGGQAWSLDIFEYAEAKMPAMERKTAEGYRSSLHAFARYLGKERCDINEITHKMVVDFRTYLETEPAVKGNGMTYKAKAKGCRAVSYYLGCLRALHNMAREEFNDYDVGLVRIPRQPFLGGVIPSQPSTQHRALSAQKVLEVYQYQTDDKHIQMARDAFMLSFFLIGMNSVDMWSLEADQLQDGVITYNRSKTDSVRQDKAIMKVRVESEAAEIMERWRDQTGHRLLSYSRMYSTASNFNRYLNRYLKRIDPELTFYAARHSWATLARNECGIPFDVVHESLNHSRRGDERVTDIYIQRDWSRVWEANRKVMDMLNL